MKTGKVHTKNLKKKKKTERERELRGGGGENYKVKKKGRESRLKQVTIDRVVKI